jgi:SAM-dependent methyltransferase
MSETVSLDLGSGPNPKNFFECDIVYGLDIQPDLGDKVKYADLSTDLIPFNSEFFNCVTAHDFLEHIPRIIYAPQRRFPFVELMNEVFRVLKRGGKFLSVTPAYPHAEAFSDPTHVNIITEQTFSNYFDEKHFRARTYGFRG